MTRLDEAFRLHQAGDLRGADALYASILAEDPHNAEVLHYRGVLAQQAGDARLAVARLEQAAGLAPGNAACWSNFGLALQALGRLEQAEAALRRAIAIAPDMAEAHANLGGLLNTKEDFPQAEAHCREALRLRADFPAALNNLGIALAAEDCGDEAIGCYRRAIELNPNSVDAHRNLGHVLRGQGNFDQARREYETVIRLNPRETKACYSLALTRRYTLADQPEIDRLEARLRAGGSAGEQADLHFALGKIYDDCGQWDRAFDHFRSGNEAVGLPLDRQAVGESIEALIRAFRPDPIAATAAAGNPSLQPIFIVGMPRSGTTLVEQILATRPQVAACGEVMDLDRIAHELQAHSTPAASWPSCLLTMEPSALGELADRYLARRLARRPDALRTTDKMPTNFLHLGLIWRMLPQAQVIHCRRDPVDVCLSCYFIDFSMRPAFAYDLSHLGFFYRLYERLMKHWQSVLPLRILDVQYEQLVAQPAREARRIVEFCGLPWDESCLRFHENRGPVRSSSAWQVRQPVYSTAVGRWHHYQRHLGPLLEALSDR